MRTVTIQIEGMKELDCAARIQRALGSVPTVKGVYVSLGKAVVELELDSDELLFAAVRAAGNFTPIKNNPAPQTPKVTRQWDSFFAATPQPTIDQMSVKPVKNGA